ncbi:hypothetical protein LIER_04331 [Lithospermum erythrorhizon]|uniref:J domain-containing protein n=1 Tax=Lithospermum erythrorhizon TaxID=34254 RepID=A0AAV3P163_LITER
MDCNKDEAVRAKTIAERKLESKDYSGAKIFALKAQNLFPGLEGISQMLTTIDVYVSSENKISGEGDWYGVLGVTPSVDDETLRKQYRKLALVLHPDKNKSVGADGAFKLLSEAWRLLSDKSKRSAYNQRRSLKGFQQKVKTQPSSPSAFSWATEFHKFSNRSAAAQKVHNSTAPAPPKVVPTSSQQRTDTFWTSCHLCKMHHEYLKLYLNTTLLCPNCRKLFIAKETAPPSGHFKSSNLSSRQYYQGSTARSSSGSLDPGINVPRSIPSGHSSYIYSDLHGGVPPRNAGGNSLDPSACFTQEQGIMQRDRNNIIRSFFKEQTFLKKSRVGADDYPFGANMNHHATMGNNSFRNFSSGSTKSGRNARWVDGFPGTHQKSKGFRQLTLMDLRKMLMGKARNEIQMNLNNWKSKTAAEPSDVKKENVEKANQAKYKKTPHVGNGIDKNSASKRSDPVNSSYSVSNVANDDFAAESMSVPDPDFHDFDMDRSESSFGEGEIWAAYDDDDSMPRYYAFISKVISRMPFKVRLSWLNSKTNNEFSTINWVGSGFYKTCGEFRVGRYEVNNTINSFSHKVKWFKGPPGTIHIFPKKGDVWALYSNWSPDWNKHTPDEVRHKYEMALVLDDYSEEQGISVAPLVKDVGFRTVFYPHMDPKKIKRIPKEEMFRFSHQVPNYSLTGEEVKSAPKNCQELDPAATPDELHQIASEDEEGQATINHEDAKVMEMQSTAQVG